MIFRVTTETSREVHFEAGSAAVLKFWVHGINLITKEAKSGS